MRMIRCRTRMRIGTTRITGTSMPSRGMGTNLTLTRTITKRWRTITRTRPICITATGISETTTCGATSCRW